MKSGLSHGDRVVFLGIGPRGAHGDVVKDNGRTANIRLDEHGGMLVRTEDLHSIPRRPKPDF